MTSKVMIVDDSMLVRKQVGNALIGAGFAIVEAADGVDALAKLTTHADVSLVLCDVNMPRMNGLEFLERSPPGLAVVMLTTEGQPELMQRAKVLGAKGWLMKPFKPDMLIATARKLTGTS